MKNRKNILVLSGGGFKGAFQIGALEALRENWKRYTGLKTPMYFDKISGVSVGALNGAMIAMGETGFKNLLHLWYELIGVKGVSEIYTSTILEIIEKDKKASLGFKPQGIVKEVLPKFNFGFRFFRDLPVLFSKNKRIEFLNLLQQRILQEVGKNFQNFRGLADNSPLLEKLKKYIHRDQLISEFRCGFVSLDTGEYHSVLAQYFETNEDFIKGILASTTMPIVWTPVSKIKFRDSNGKKIIARNCVDGGIRNVTPLGDIIRSMNPNDEYHIFIINCQNGSISEDEFSNKNIGQIALRSLQEIASAEIFNNDLSEFLKINDMIKQNTINKGANLLHFSNHNRKRSKRVLKAFNYTIIEPSSSDLGNPLISTGRLFKKRLKEGKKEALKAIDPE